CGPPSLLSHPQGRLRRAKSGRRRCRPIPSLWQTCPLSPDRDRRASLVLRARVLRHQRLPLAMSARIRSFRVINPILSPPLAAPHRPRDRIREGVPHAPICPEPTPAAVRRRVSGPPPASNLSSLRRVSSRLSSGRSTLQAISSISVFSIRRTPRLRQNPRPIPRQVKTRYHRPRPRPLLAFPAVSCQQQIPPNRQPHRPSRSTAISLRGFGHHR